MIVPHVKRSVPVEEIVDFDEEIETFKRMVAGEDGKRLMFICAPGGRGKTCLLQQMREHCRTKTVTCCWVDFRFESYDAPHLTLAREMCEQLRLSPRHLAQALLPLSAYGAKGEASAEIKGDVTDSQVITQVLIKVSLTDETLYQGSIKQRLKRAFTTDLSTAGELLVCFLDSFEDVSSEEESWLLDALFHPVREGELENMIIVTGGRRWPKINDWEWEDDAHLINGLPLMSEKHIREFAKKLGYVMSEEEARICWRACRGGLPILMGVVIKSLRRVGKVA